MPSENVNNTEAGKDTQWDNWHDTKRHVAEMEGGWLTLGRERWSEGGDGSQIDICFKVQLTAAVSEVEFLLICSYSVRCQCVSLYVCVWERARQVRLRSNECSGLEDQSHCSTKPATCQKLPPSARRPDVHVCLLLSCYIQRGSEILKTHSCTTRKMNLSGGGWVGGGSLRQPHNLNDKYKKDTVWRGNAARRGKKAVWPQV